MIGLLSTYIIAQPMTYRIRATDAEEAADLARENGELIVTGEAIDYERYDAAPPSRRPPPLASPALSGVR